MYPSFFTRRPTHYIFAYLVAMMVLSGCASTFKHPVEPAPPRYGEFSSVHKKDLSELPGPDEKVYAAVYSFRDQTGQYKLSENASSWSTAVTQGATSVLLQSLEESGWFTTIEREGLSNLLNERRIIRQTQEQYQGNSNALSPLLYAGVIIEGGIIAYESNIRTGGIGARYFGTGASGEYREDQVTVYLRAISTSSGRILKTVHASKTMLSQKLDMGIFRYVSLKRLLEAETGYTYNEPSFVAVQEAIDKAVLALIIEGVEENLWELQDSTQMESDVFRRYFAERDNDYNTDHLGNMEIQKEGKFSVGGGLSPVLYDGDLGSGKLRRHGYFELGFFRDGPFQLEWHTGIGRPSNGDDYDAKMASSSLVFHYDMFHHLKSTPFIEAGYGALYQDDERWFLEKPEWNKNLFQFIHLGLGYQWKINNMPLYLNTSVSSQVLMNDNLDGLSYGKYNDRLWYFNIGIEYRFNLFKNN
ncbi:MAG: CsgG/HfaB family protein [Marinilabiliaceae bacterium]